MNSASLSAYLLMGKDIESWCWGMSSEIRVWIEIVISVSRKGPHCKHALDS